MNPTVGETSGASSTDVAQISAVGLDPREARLDRCVGATAR